MASSSEDSEDVRNFFQFTERPLPRVVAPMSALSLNSHDWEDESSVTSERSAVEPPKKNGLEYVHQFLKEEQDKINKIKLGNARRGEVRTESDGRGRMPRGRGNRGRNDNDRGYGNRREQFGRSRGLAEISIYGTIPDGPVSDTEVFLKYDFNQRVFDTSGLVINCVREKIMSGLNNHQVMTIEGFTGCGKTTQVPQFILDDAVINHQTCRIAVTQPRRIAAISVANRVASERNWRVGGIIGYQVGMDKKTSDDTRLTYMTTGVLLQLLISRKSLGEWTHIIIDEVHERDLETDLLLLVIKKIMVDTANDKTRIILMSATLNTAKFTQYFPLWENANFSGKSVNVKVGLPNQYPVKELYLEDAAAIAGYDNYSMDNFEEPRIYQECYEIATKIIEGLDSNDQMEEQESGGRRGAVLIFLPGLLEIETLFKILTEVSGGCGPPRGDPNKKNLKWSVLPLHSSITNEEQQRVFIPARKGFRKIILATNIAESSITVPDIKYVIDFCLTKNLSCDPVTNYTCLRLEWASKNQCIQRRGRCGRVSAGTLFRMVSKKFYATLEQEARPEMLRSSLESVVLQVKLLDMGSPKSVLALSVDPPDESNIKRAVANLKEIGALTILVGAGAQYDAYDGDLTFVGKVLSRLPIDIRLGRLILLGHAFDCLDEAVIIAAGLSVKSPFAYPYTKRLEAYMAKLTWSTKSFSDCIALYNLYTNWFKRHQHREFKVFPDEKTWAKTYFVQLTSLREMKVLVDELYKRLRMCGIELIPSQKEKKQEQLLLVKLVIAGAFYPNYFTRPRPNAKDYLKEIARDVQGKDPYSSIVFQGFPMEQPGELYKKIIARFVSFDKCVPHMDFHGSRVVVTFDSHGNSLGPISLGVYRSVKLRQLRHIVTFGTPSRDLAYKMLNDKKMKQETSDVVLSPRPSPMPGLGTPTVQIIVTHIESPSEFYGTFKTDESSAHYIAEKLEEFKRSYSPIRRDQFQIGQLCIALFRGKFYRGRVDSELDKYDDIMVKLIDNGMSVKISRNSIFCVGKLALEAGLHRIPALAIQCHLKEVRPSLRNDCVWCNEALLLFENYCAANNYQVFVEIYGIAACVISGVVRNSIDLEKASINKILVEKKYADTCSETPAFQENFTMRERMKFDLRSDVVSNMKTFEDQQNKYCVPEKLFEPPNMGEDAEQQVTLRGPHSPLEMTFTALCGSAHLKQVVTDGSSINSVALDQDPYAPSARLMIAANVAIAQRSGNILARETTIMPPIPGLTGLLAMLFCPKIEFRVDDDCTMYTGCLTGLGLDPTTNDSAYSDHDMEVVFDTKIDNQDVSLVNSIRSGMNSVLSDKISKNEIRNIRDRMRLEAMTLLERERTSMEEIWPEQTHIWTPSEEGDDLPSGSRRRQVAREAGAVFPLHEPLTFQVAPEGSDQPRYNRNLYFMLSGENAQG